MGMTVVTYVTWHQWCHRLGRMIFPWGDVNLGVMPRIGFIILDDDLPKVIGMEILHQGLSNSLVGDVAPSQTMPI